MQLMLTSKCWSGNFIVYISICDFKKDQKTNQVERWVGKNIVRRIRNKEINKNDSPSAETLIPKKIPKH